MSEVGSFALKGELVDSGLSKQLRCREGHYLVCVDGRSVGVFAELPERYRGLPLADYTGRLVIPGLCDLHLHAPQYSFRGLGMDMELLEWLSTNTFPEEGRYADPVYAKRAYEIFAADLKRAATTRACVFATTHTEATLLLMELLDQTGLKTMVGKVNIDRNSPDFYRESTEGSLADTAAWLAGCRGRFENCAPILTPRFTPSCTDTLLAGLGELQRASGRPVQSHLSENLSEIAWVKALCPDTAFYGETYDRFGLFGGDCPTIMAHCVHSGEAELALMRERGVYLAHCPQSNTNLASGIAPVRSWLEAGLRVGLGSDIAGGSSLSIFRAICDTIQASKLRWRLADDTQRPLTLPEAFYLATRGGGAFFGQVGCFDEGYELDAVVLEDESLPAPRRFSLAERLERLVYLSDDRNILAKYVSGRKIMEGGVSI